MSYVSPWWQAALLPEAWDVAGFACPSLTLWQLYALENLGNAYAVGFTPCMDDAAGLLLVATTNRRDLSRMLINPAAFNRAVRRLHARLRKQKWIDVHNACTDYFNACTRAPDRKIAEGTTGSTSGAPYQWHIMLCLCSQYGMTPDAAWCTPYAVARCMYDTWAEAQGDKSLVHPKTQRTIDEMQEQAHGRDC